MSQTHSDGARLMRGWLITRRTVRMSNPAS
jgi:hypothetical protein